MAIFWQFFKAERGTVIVWAAVMGLIAAWIASVYPSTAASIDLPAWLSHYPSWLRAMAGPIPEWPSMKAWVQIELLSYLQLLLGYFAVALAAGIYTRELEQGTAEFLFTLPFPRWRIVLARLGAVAMQSAVVHAVVYGAVQGTVVVLGQPLEVAAYLRAFLVAYAVNLSLAAFALWWGTFFSEYSKAVVTAMLIIVAVYLFNLTAPSSGPLRQLALWNPLSNVNVFHALWGRGFPWADLAVAVVFFVIFTGLALIRVERREVYS